MKEMCFDKIERYSFVGAPLSPNSLPIWNKILDIRMLASVLMILDRSNLMK